MNMVRKAINNILIDLLIQVIGGSMKDAAEDAIRDVLARFVGDILDKEDFDRYCDDIYWRVSNAVDETIELAFKEGNYDA